MGASDGVFGVSSTEIREIQFDFQSFFCCFFPSFLIDRLKQTKVDNLQSNRLFLMKISDRQIENLVSNTN